MRSVYRGEFDAEAALALLPQTDDESLEIGDRLGEGSSLGNLGSVYHSLGRYENAIDYYQQTLEMAKEIGDKQGEADTWFNLGLVLEKLKQKSDAVEVYGNARQLYAAMGLDVYIQKCDEVIERLSESKGFWSRLGGWFSLE